MVAVVAWVVAARAAAIAITFVFMLLVVIAIIVIACRLWGAISPRSLTQIVATALDRRCADLLCTAPAVINSN